jgi:hypothetical protein
MSKKSIAIISHYGGLSSDIKQGTPHSFAYSKHIDFRKSPTSMTILPRTVKETGTTVTGLITEMLQLPSGKIVAVDTAGGVYVRTTAGAWSKHATSLTSATSGMFYDLPTDTIYVPSLTTLGIINNADGRFGGSLTPVANSISTTLDKSATSSANTYTTTNNITETATHMLLVTPTIEPMYSIHIWVTTKGSGDLVVTMHDPANNVLGTVTVANATLTNGALNAFVFATPVRTTTKPNGATYHFHITHPSGTASTIGCATASDFSTARYATYANRFVTPTNQFHPCIDFMQYHLIGNGRYVSTWEVLNQTTPVENTEYYRHRLVFPSGYEATSFGLYNEYVAIGAEKRSTSATDEIQDGKIFFWDGLSTTYNYVIPTPEGSPYGLYSSGNILYYFCNGARWAYAGGNPVKVDQIAGTDYEYTDTSTYTVNYPNTQTIRNGILMSAFPSETNSANIEHGIYSYGSRNKNYPKSSGLSYTISTGNVLNGTLRLGCVKSFGDKMFIAWRDGASYGVDIVNPSSDPFPTATWESLIIDNGRPDKAKQATHVNVTFKALPVGATVTPKYKIDRGSWVNGDTAIAGATSIKLPINKRYYELQLGLGLVATTITPEITGIVFVYDDLVGEKD